MSSSSYYQLNSLNRIVDAGGAWDAFAQENNAPGAVRSSVVGKSIWDFVRTAELQAYMNALFVACRVTGEPVSLPYRCDAPDRPRPYTMTITPLKKCGLRVTHECGAPEHAQIAKNCVPLTSHHAKEKCSVCCAFKVGDEWIDPFAQPLESDFPKGLGLCSKCKADAVATLATIYHKAQA